MALRHVTSYAQYRGNVIETPPGSEPVTAAELRTFLRTNETDLPDAEANAFITESRQYIEELTGLALINQRWKLFLDHWPMTQSGGPWWDGVRDGAISELSAPSNLRSVYMPRYPLSSVAAVTVYDEGGDPTSIAVADVFDVDTAQRPGRLTLKNSQTWPVALQSNNAVEIEYISGYGADATAVPAALKRAVKQLAAALYTRRGDGCGCDQVYEGSGASGILGPFEVRMI